MTYFALVGAPVEAGGHPGACSPTASGTVEGDSTVSVNGTAVAVEQDSSLEFPSHGHDVDPETGACISDSSHSIQQEAVASTVSVDGKALYVTDSGVATDPGSGGSVDYVSSGGNESVQTS